MRSPARLGLPEAYPLVLLQSPLHFLAPTLFQPQALPAWPSMSNSNHLLVGTPCPSRCPHPACTHEPLPGSGTSRACARRSHAGPRCWPPPPASPRAPHRPALQAALPVTKNILISASPLSSSCSRTPRAFYHSHLHRPPFQEAFLAAPPTHTGLSPSSAPLSNLGRTSKSILSLQESLPRLPGQPWEGKGGRPLCAEPRPSIPVRVGSSVNASRIWTQDSGFSRQRALTG